MHLAFNVRIVTKGSVTSGMSIKSSLRVRFGNGALLPKRSWGLRLAPACLFPILVLTGGIFWFSATASYGQKSSIGVNLAGDWLWADAVRQARPHWDTAANLGDGAATQDSNGWPTEDCSLVVWEGHAYNDGTYTLSFSGQATISVSYGFGTVNGSSSSSGNYNSTTNTTTAAVTIIDTGAENCSIIFTQTKRTSASATNTGITNVHLYRPITEGASTSYSAGTLFTNQTLAMSSNFCVTRFMDQLGANNSTQVNWSDRPLPGAWNQNPIAYEYVVAYGNATNADIYINIPVYATPAYFTNLANLVKYGSDGVNPYTSAQANPVYAPLNSNLQVYLEYSNEVWNGGFQQCNENYNTVTADQSANNAEWSILNFDGGAASNLWTGAWRRVIYQAKLISDAFRAVYGDAAMPPNANAIVRPLIEFQAGNGQATGSTQLQFLDNYFNNSDGVPHVTTPHPVSYFLWGGGGATYYNSNNDAASTVDALFNSGIPSTGYPATTQIDTALVKAYGLKRVAYEGGWSVYNGTNGFSSTPGSAAALAKFDSRATTAQTTAHTIFQQSGGDLDIFYTSSSWAPTYIWSLTDQIFNLTTPLYQATSVIDTNSNPAITYGNAISGTAATTLAYGSQLFADSTYNAGLPDNGALGFLPLITSPGDYKISLMINTSSSGKFVQVLLDGITVGDPISVPVSNSPVSVNVGTFLLAAGQHGLIVQGQYTSNNNYSGNSCSFTSVVLTPVSTLQITGQPQSQVATLGAPASFSVAATGSGLDYQWQFDGVSLSGQTGSTLTFNSVTARQAGTYTVIVSEGSEQIPSATATLTVQANYTQWIAQFPAWQQAGFAITGLSATPQNDGVPNLLKYLYDINPTAPLSSSDRAALAIGALDTTTRPGTTYLVLKYRQYAALTGITVGVQTSQDMQTWTTISVPDISKQIGIDSTTGDPLMETGVIVPAGTPSLFIRLNVTLP
jgi:hypothetical protein